MPLQPHELRHHLRRTPSRGKRSLVKLAYYLRSYSTNALLQNAGEWYHGRAPIPPRDALIAALIEVAAADPTNAERLSYELATWQSRGYLRPDPIHSRTGRNASAYVAPSPNSAAPDPEKEPEPSWIVPPPATAPVVEPEPAPNPSILSIIVDNLRNGEHTLLVGPAGCGKSTLAKMAAAELGREYILQPFAGGTQDYHLMGRLMQTEEGTWQYIPGPFVRAWETGTLYIADEMDALADDGVLMMLNDALNLTTRRLAVPGRTHHPMADRHELFGFVGTANTFGRGASATYSGRSPLDGAILDRFVGCIVTVDYDAQYEAAAVEAAPHGAELLKWVRAIRPVIQSQDLRRVLSTRALQTGAAHLKRGRTLARVRAELLTGWTQDELEAIKTVASLNSTDPARVQSVANGGAC